MTYKYIFQAWFVIIVLLAVGGCVTDQEHTQSDTLFRLVDGGESGVNFANNLSYTREFNIYTYRNFYNGGGVAIGDVNNDGLADLFLTANMGENKLYLNRGKFKFEDISIKAGIQGSRFWSTGVNMVDVNGDGLLDIYVSNSGNGVDDDRQNELFINNGDLTFSEKAKEYGLADQGLSTHASFFDYDKDGDLDVYILNNSFRAIGSFDLRMNQREVRDSTGGGHKLLRNDDGHFTDVSEAAGIYGSVIGFGLGVSVSDFNQDGWQDLYVCNDFFERDYLYINNHDGTFREMLSTQMRSISMASMGVDAADMNGDGYPEIFVSEMLPKDEARLKTSMTFENWTKYRFNVDNGYHHQFTRNMLHQNLALPAGKDPVFSEIGRIAGVEASDWSWSTLICDLDNNGFKDIFITNGLLKDILNQDYLRYISNDVVFNSIATGSGVDYKTLIDSIPSKAIGNFAFSSERNFAFRDETMNWGLGSPGFSNGAAYGDLDNDGDQDLVVNNVNMKAFLYENQTEKKQSAHHYLKLRLVGEGKNKFGIGTTVTLICQGKKFALEQMPTRGFQSSVDYSLIFGLGAVTNVDSMIVRWPSGVEELKTNITVDQTLTAHVRDAHIISADKSESIGSASPFCFKDKSNTLPASFGHQENNSNDFDSEPLLFHMNSREGPRVAVGDVNGDGFEDIYLGTAKNMEKKLYLGQANGSFMERRVAAFDQDKRCEDVDALFFDADHDRDLDLYVVSGSNEYSQSSSALSDRLYFNDGRGNFRKSEQLLPTNKFESTSCVAASDFDQDGDLDLFVGASLKVNNYGVPPNNYLLVNDGAGGFTDLTMDLAPGLGTIGMVKDVAFADVNGDRQPDLIVVGEWMPITIFVNEKGKFHNVTATLGLSDDQGWWNRIFADDLDDDGDIDFIVGNHGLNSRFRASKDQPIQCLINDFDDNGTVEQILSVYNQDKSYPMALWHDLVGQVPSLKKKFLKYEDYKLKTVDDLFTPEKVAKSKTLSVNNLESVVMINDGGKFRISPLPFEAQLSPVYAIGCHDLNGDGFKDILLGGNLFEVKPEVGRYDASYGTILLGSATGKFSSFSNSEANLFIQGEVRDMIWVNKGEQKSLLVFSNDSPVQRLVLVQNNRMIKKEKSQRLSTR